MIVCEKPEEAISRIYSNLHEYNLTLVCQSEVTKEETDVEQNLKRISEKNKANFITIWGSTLYHKSDMPFSIASVPDSYTAFRKDVEHRLKIRPEVSMPEKLKPLPTFESMIPWGDLPSYEVLNSSKPLVSPSSAFPFSGGETAAMQRLKSYLWDTDAVARYKETRNGLIGAEYSTKFSPWLSLGCLSPRKIHWELQKYEQERTNNQSTYWVRFELLWRDYFKFVSMKYGDRIFYPYGMKGKRQQWKKDMELFKAWQSTFKDFILNLVSYSFVNSCYPFWNVTHDLLIFLVGQTGVPFVDANMRELLATGWMSNRGRQNVASFLVKDLHLDWRLGAEWFESLLLDHDVCSNYGNWNYVAGTYFTTIAKEFRSLIAKLFSF